jgi:hypothetical protein
MTLLFETWTLIFWIPTLVSAGTGWFALEHGMLVRPIPTALWFITALLLQFTAPLFSAAWAAGMLAQVALAVYLSIRLKLEA